MKVFSIITILFLMTGCTSDDVTISKEEYERLTNDTIKPEYPKPFKLYDHNLKSYADGIVSGSDGHEYIVICHDSKFGATLHSPECKICFKKDSI